MTIRIITLWTDDWKILADLTTTISNQYCERHGYISTFFGFSTNCLDGYDKISLLKSGFDRNAADLYWLLDADAIITNQNIKVENFVEEGFDLFLCEDFNGINCGSFIIRDSEWSRKFIYYILLKRGVVGMHCEQDAIKSYMEEFPNDEKIKILTHPSINSYDYCLYPEIPPQTHEQGQWQPGDFVLHLPGTSLEKRIEVFKKVLNEKQL